MNCAIVEAYEDGERWTTSWSSTNNFTSYYELVWPNGAGFYPSMPASQSIDCQVAPNTVLSMVRGYTWTDVSNTY
jgi:hypothetical protein